MATFNYESYVKRDANSNSNSGSKVKYLSSYLHNDGDKVLVRFPYNSVNDIEFCDVHKVNVPGSKYPRQVSCLREDYDPVEACPLCASGNKPSSKVYLKGIAYVTDENGKDVVVPFVWERPSFFVKKLVDFFEEGTIHNVFRIKRNGVAPKVEYDVIPMDSNIYNTTNYPADFTSLNNFKPAGFAYLEKTAAEMYGLLAQPIAGTLKEENTELELPENFYAQSQPVSTQQAVPTPQAAPTPQPQAVPQPNTQSTYYNYNRPVNNAAEATQQGQAYTQPNSAERPRRLY